MTRKLLALFLCTSLLFTLFGCGVKENFHGWDNEDAPQDQTPASASDPSEDRPPLSGDPVQALRSLGEESGFQNAFSELEVTSSVTMEDASFQRLQQNYCGIPVYGKTVTYVTDETGEMLTVTGNAEDVDESLSLTPDLLPEELEAIAAENLDGAVICGALQFLQMSDPELCVYHQDGKSHLAYSTCVNYVGDEGAGIQEFVIDAHDGSVLLSVSNVLFAEYVTGELVGQETVYPNVEYSDYGDSWGLSDPNRNLHTFTAVNEEIPVVGAGIHGSGLEDTGIYQIYDYQGYGEPISWTEGTDPDYAAVDAYVNTQISYDYFASVLGHESADGNGGSEIRIYVGMAYDFACNYGKFMSFYNNAASSTNRSSGVTTLYYGLSTGGNVNDAQDLDIVAHEYMHAVETYGSDMTPLGESGALKEALSDIFGTLVEAWHYETSPDWVNNSRNMKTPSSSGNPELYGGQNWADPTDHSAENDCGGIHKNSTVISHAAYRMWSSGDFTDTELAQIWYRAMLMMPTDCTFHQARSLVELAARTMEMSEEQLLEIATAFDCVGILEPETPVYELRERGSLIVLDANDEPYGDYTVVIRQKLGALQEGAAPDLRSLFPVTLPVVDTLHVLSPDPIRLDLQPGVYWLELTDNAHPDRSVEICVELLDGSGEESMTLYTDFGEANAAGVEFSMHEFTRTLTTTGGVDVYVFHLIYPLFEGDTPAEVLLNEGYARILEEWGGELNWTADELYEEWEDNLEAAAFPFEEELIGEVTYNGNGCFALVETGYLWGGGAHPNHYTNNYLFDIATGEELTLDQILVGSEEEIDEVLMHYAAEASLSVEVDLNHLKNNCSFALNKDGLTFHYQDPTMYRVQCEILIPFTNEDLYVISAGELIRSWESGS